MGGGSPPTGGGPVSAILSSPGEASRAKPFRTISFQSRWMRPRFTGEPGFEIRQVLRRGILRLPAEDALQMFDDRMKGARRVKRRTADRHPDVILAARLWQSFHLSGLADPCIPLNKPDMASA